MIWNILNKLQCKISGFSLCRVIFLIFIVLILIMSLSSCSPDTFMINKYYEPSWVRVKMMNGLDKAEKINENSFKINENAIVSMKVLETTQYSSEFDLELTQGNEIDFYLFTTEYDFEDIPLLKIILTDKNYRIEKEGNIIAESDSLKILPLTFHRIKFHQEANMFRFTFDCAELPFPGVWLKSSEYIIVRTKGDTKAIIRGITNKSNFEKLTPTFD